MENIIVISILIIITCLIIAYLVRQKKQGAVCVGCPYAKQCQSKGGKGGCSCGGADNKQSTAPEEKNENSH